MSTRSLSMEGYWFLSKTFFFFFFFLNQLIQPLLCPIRSFGEIHLFWIRFCTILNYWPIIIRSSKVSVLNVINSNIYTNKHHIAQKGWFCWKNKKQLSSNICDLKVPRLSLHWTTTVILNTLAVHVVRQKQHILTSFVRLCTHKLVTCPLL